MSSHRNTLEMIKKHFIIIATIYIVLGCLIYGFDILNLTALSTGCGCILSLFLLISILWITILNHFYIETTQTNEQRIKRHEDTSKMLKEIRDLIVLPFKILKWTILIVTIISAIILLIKLLSYFLLWVLLL